MMDNQLYLIQMGKKIREIRRAKGISMRKLEKMTNLNKSSISFIENGKSNTYLLTLKLIADVLEVDVKDFL